jgi:REP element-mobilizing transposase RayT
VPIFARRTDYRAFIGILQQGLERYPVQLLAYCILSNHWHLVLEPAGTKALIDFMHWVTATHAMRWHRHNKTVGQGPVYQGRYRSVPIDSADGLMRACRYVERNALAASLVARAEDWPWCSLAERIRGLGDLPLKPAPFLTSSAWIDFVNTATDMEKLIGATTPDDWREFVYLQGPNYPRERLPRRPGTKVVKTVEKGYVPLDTSLDHPPQTPGTGLAAGTQAGEHVVDVAAPAHQNQPDPHVEGPEHLLVGDAPRALQPGEQRRDGPAVAIE